MFPSSGTTTRPFGKMLALAAALCAAAIPVSASFWIGPLHKPTITALPPEIVAFDVQTRTGAELAVDDAFCDHRDLVRASLFDDYGERIARSLELESGRTLDFWQSSVSGTWTVVYTRPDGISCVADSGDAWSSNGDRHPLMAQFGQII